MFRQFDNEQALLPSLCEYIISALQFALARRGSALLAVSGGRTPVPLFEQLSQQQLDWSQVSIVLVDERWLPEDHPDSNARLVQQHLLINQARAAHFTGLTNDTESPFSAEQAINQRLSALPWPLDVALLGMGSDGHTASLFPQAASLANALAGRNSTGQEQSICCAIEPPAAPYARMTLTAPVLARASHLVLHLKGAEKKRVLDAAMAGDDIQAMPIRYFLQGREKKLEIYYSEN